MHHHRSFWRKTNNSGFSVLCLILAQENLSTVACQFCRATQFVGASHCSSVCIESLKSPNWNCTGARLECLLCYRAHLINCTVCLNFCTPYYDNLFTSASLCMYIYMCVYMCLHVSICIHKWFISHYLAFMCIYVYLCVMHVSCMCRDVGYTCVLCSTEHIYLVQFHISSAHGCSGISFVC